MGDSPPYSNSSTSSSGHASPRHGTYPVMNLVNGRIEAMGLHLLRGNMSPEEPMTPDNNMSPVPPETADFAPSNESSSSTVPSPVQSISPPAIAQSSSVHQSTQPAMVHRVDPDDVWTGGIPPPILLPQTWIREPKPPPVIEEKNFEKRALNELTAFLTRETEKNFGRYPCCMMKLGDRIEEVAEWVIKAGNSHKDMRYVSGVTKRTHYPKWNDKEEVWNRSILEREYYCRFGEKIFGYEQVPKCPARFNVAVREKDTPEEHFVVVEVSNLHENHPDPATGRIHGFDYSKIKIELGTVCSYRDNEENLEDARARSRKRFHYDKYVDSYVPREKFTTKPPLDPRDPKALFPRHNPYHYSKFNAATGQLVIPVEWLPVGWMDKNRSLTQEQIDNWNEKQQAQFDEVMKTWEPWEKRMMLFQLQQLIRNRDACESQAIPQGTRQRQSEILEVQSRPIEKKRTVEKSLDGSNFGRGSRPLNPVGGRRRYNGIEECLPEEQSCSMSETVIGPSSYRTIPPNSPEPIGDVCRPHRLTGMKRSSVPLVPIQQALQRMAKQRGSSEEDDLPTDLSDIESPTGTAEF